MAMFCSRITHRGSSVGRPEKARVALANITKGMAIAGAVSAGALLAGCTVSERHLSPNFGSALKQDVAAQIADPDARYAGTPAPGSNGERAALAQKRYDRDAVLRPARTQTATLGGGSGGSGGGAGGGASEGGESGMSAQ